MKAWVWTSDNKETEGPQSVGGRNGDQYRTAVRQGSGGGGAADRAREAWSSDRGRDGAEDGHSLTVRDGEGGRRRRAGGEWDEGGWMRGIHSVEKRKKGGSNKRDDEMEGKKESLHKLLLLSEGQWSIVRP